MTVRSRKGGLKPPISGWHGLCVFGLFGRPTQNDSLEGASLSYMLLVFGHLLAASMALGAIVATDLRLLSKLSQDKVRIAPPNQFVVRIVMVALLLLYLTGGAIVWHGLGQRADYLDNPKLQAKILLVVLLTLNAFVLHHVTFPRLARGRRVARWHFTDWVVVAVPVAVSNFLWMFVAFLGIARAWSYSMPMRDIFEIAAGLYLVAQCGVFTILAMAGRKVQPDSRAWTDRLARSLAAVGSLGRTDLASQAPRSRSRRRRGDAAAALSQPAATSLPAAEQPLPATRPALRLIDDGGLAAAATRRATR
ncbi:MAG: hypothetical protein ACXWJA_12765 [Caldimonas sp.]